MEALHAIGPEMVIISSTDLIPDKITLYASKKGQEKIRVIIPPILNKEGKTYFAGTGDLLTS